MRIADPIVERQPIMVCPANGLVADMDLTGCQWTGQYPKPGAKSEKFARFVPIAPEAEWAVLLRSGLRYFPPGTPMVLTRMLSVFTVRDPEGIWGA